MSGIFQMVPLDGCWHNYSSAFWEPLAAALKATWLFQHSRLWDLCVFVGMESHVGFQAINTAFIVLVLAPYQML